MASKNDHDGHPDGIVHGTATSLQAWWGATPRLAMTFIASLGTTSTTTSVKTAFNQLRQRLISIGLMKSS